MLEQLRALDGDAGAAVAAYLDLVGYRLLDGFDISGPCALELPDVLLRAIRVAVEPDGRTRRPTSRRGSPRCASKVPEEHRGEFDELLGEARLTYRLRDERGVFSDIWASGLMRRAVLAAGRRLAAQRAHRTSPSTSIDASFDEMCALLVGRGRARPRTSSPRAPRTARRTPPRTPRRVLGDPPSPPPDPSGLPPAAARVMRAMGIAMGEMFGSSEAEHEEHMLRGLAASRGVYEGPARRVSGPSEFDRIVKGDVLVTESTSEAFNILLPLLGAIVTDSGGLLSHSAIVAREYGIPGVVGTREATERIADGDARARRRRRRRGDGARVSEVVPLVEARDTSLFGSKAVGLGQALRDGLPVPPGVALAGAVVEAVAGRDEDAIEQVAEPVRPLGGPLAVRSSAVDEDGAEASFAGQHLTLLNVPGVGRADRRASSEIWWSANSDSAITYRQRVGLFTRPSVGVVVQALLDPETRRGDVHPEPDHRRRRARDRGELGARRGRRRRPRDPRPLPPRPLRRGARAHAPGARTIAIRSLPDGGTVEEQVAPELVEALCLDDEPARRARAASPTAASRSTGPRATSSGRSPTGRSTCCSAERYTTGRSA